jgi:CubicO group peptidase (beta-lactamase class C family)
MITGPSGGLERAVELVRARRVPAQLRVLHDGNVVADEAVRCRPDALFWTFSAGKPFIAMLVHELAQRGALSLDDPVAAHWPEFGRHGKDAITIRHVLQHRSGLGLARGMLGDGLAMTNWRRSLRNIERAAPRCPAGQATAYQAIIYGFILGEVARRVTSTELPSLLRSTILRPLGLASTYLGLPDQLWPRHVPIRVRGRAGLLSQIQLNRRATRRAVIPSAGISTTAADLARFYQGLLGGGVLDGLQLMSPEAIEEARRPSGHADLDPAAGMPTRWAQGFQLGYPGYGGGRPRPMGQLASTETFGHNGSNCCLAWADPMRRLVFAYLTSEVPAYREGASHVSSVSDAVLRACY